MFWGKIFLSLSLAISLLVGMKLSEQYSPPTTNGTLVGCALIFLTTLLMGLGFCLSTTKFGTKLGELCKLFGCNFGELAAMKFETIVDKAKNILNETILELIEKEKKHGPKNTITLVARRQYEDICGLLVALGLHSGKVDEEFAEAKEEYEKKNLAGLTPATT